MEGNQHKYTYGYICMSIGIHIDYIYISRHYYVVSEELELIKLPYSVSVVDTQVSLQPKSRS